MKSVNARLRSGKTQIIVKQLRQRLRHGAYMSKLPGITVLAKELGVNKNTVNKALTELVAEGLLVRRKGFGTFVAGKEPKQVLNRGRVNSRRYAFLINSFEQYHGYMSLLDGCNDVFSKLGGSLIYVRYPEEEAEYQMLLGKLRAQRIEGVLVCSVVKNSLLVQLKREFSVVLADCLPRLAQANAIGWDNYYIGYQLVQSLYNKGCRQFIVLGITEGGTDEVSGDSNHSERIAGVRGAATELGIPCQICYTDWQLSKIACNKQFSAAIRHNPAETAFLCFHAELIPKVLQRTRCLDLMEQLRVGSLGTRECIASSFSGIYAHMDMVRLGREAANMLTNIIGRSSSRFRREVLIPEIIDTIEE